MKHRIKSFFKLVDSKGFQSGERRSWLETIIIQFLSALLIFFVSLPQGIKSRIAIINLPTNASALSIRKAFGAGDAGSLLDTALSWANFEHLNVNQYWIVHLWTPGMSVIEVPLIWLQSLGLPLFWSLISLTAILWLTLIGIWWRVYSPKCGRFAMLGILFIFMTSWDFHYIFRDGLFYTEGISEALLLIGLTYFSLIFFENQKTLTRAVPFVSGACIGLSIMVRHVTDYGNFILLILAFAIFIKANGSSIALNSKVLVTPLIEFNSKILDSRKILSTKILSLSVTALFITLPWRLLSHFIYGGSFLSLSSGSTLELNENWLSSTSPVIKYWKATDLNWACQIDSLRCAQIQKITPAPHSSTLLLDEIQAILSHPFHFFQNRFSYLVSDWIPQNSISPFSLYKFDEVSILVFFVICLYFLRRNFTNVPFIQFISWWSFLATQLIQLVFIHYESRYFILVRELILGTIIMIISLLRQQQGDVVYAEDS